MNIQREISQSLQVLAKQFPVVAILGPRQSGKTTLAKETFKDYVYISLEDVDIRRIITNDPRGFFAAHAHAKGIIIDEMQEVPELFSYMQGIVDQAYRPGYFIITGSQNFLMLEKITQSLAGRIALLTLLPLTVSELRDANLLPTTLDELIIKGCYPRVYVQPLDVQTWYNNYITTYVERDVRQVLKVNDILAFQRFIKLCAARTGNLLNLADLARDADISPNTAKAWISVLEASYIIYLLAPMHKNFSKRIIKSPKLFFNDTGVLCSLLDIKHAQDLYMHPMRGAIFETFVMSELFKYRYNANEKPNLFYWRDVQGHEVDAIFEKSFSTIIPIEIKSSMTIQPSFFKGIATFQEIAKRKMQAYVIYAGNINIVHAHAHLYPWSDIKMLVSHFDDPA